MGILWRYVAREYVKAFAATLVAVVAIFLVVDFVDRAKAYTGEGWQRAAAELYLYKGVLVAYQLAPAALLLAAGIALASMRRRGEFTATRALAVSPARLLGPIGVVALLAAGGLGAFDEYVVGPSSRAVDDISVNRFRSYGDWALFFTPTRWFRGKEHIYHLRSGDAESGFRDVSIYTLSPDFRLARRIDAAEMRAAGGQRWLLVHGVERGLEPGHPTFERFEEREVAFNEEAATFNIARGRPEQLKVGELREQIDRREQVGLGADRFVLALHSKAAYPLTGVPAAVLSGALALRRGRRGYLTEALAEGFLVVVGLWAAMVMFRAAALAGLYSPPLAAWLPTVVLAALASVGAWRVAR